MNCLAFALRFWEKQPEFKIHYTTGHAINLPSGSRADGFLPAEAFGYCYFNSAFAELLDDDEKELLKKYFNINGPLGESGRPCLTVYEEILGSNP